MEKTLTQQQLAERLGYKTNSYISDVKSGHFIPSRDKLKKIARDLGNIHDYEKFLNEVEAIYKKVYEIKKR